MKIELIMNSNGYLGRLNFRETNTFKETIRRRTSYVIFFVGDMDSLKNRDDFSIETYFAKENIKIAQRIKKRFY